MSQKFENFYLVEQGFSAPTLVGDYSPAVNEVLSCVTKVINERKESLRINELEIGIDFGFADDKPVIDSAYNFLLSMHADDNRAARHFREAISNGLCEKWIFYPKFTSTDKIIPVTIRVYCIGTQETHFTGLSKTLVDNKYVYSKVLLSDIKAKIHKTLD